MCLKKWRVAQDFSTGLWATFEKSKVNFPLKTKPNWWMENREWLGSTLINTQTYEASKHVHSSLRSCVCGTNYTHCVYKTASSFFTCLTQTFLIDIHSKPFLSSHCFLVFSLSGECTCVCVCVHACVILLTLYWWSDVYLIRLLSQVSLSNVHNTSVILKLPCSPKTHSHTLTTSHTQLHR